RRALGDHPVEVALLVRLVPERRRRVRDIGGGVARVTVRARRGEEDGALLDDGLALEVERGRRGRRRRGRAGGYPNVSGRWPRTRQQSAKGDQERNPERGQGPPSSIHRETPHSVNRNFRYGPCPAHSDGIE